MGRNMSFDFGLEKAELCLKRKYRWLFKIPNICADGVNSLPPIKSARPNITFKEMEVQHLNETIYFPSKPDWKPISLTLYELKTESKNPIFSWIERIYKPSNNSKWSPSVVPGSSNSFKIPQCRLELYDGCGETLETWVYEAVWPQTIEFGDLDMSLSDIVTLDITLRYDRAYIE